MSPSFSWLRCNGYIVTSRWVFTKQCYLYNVKRGRSTKLYLQAGRSRAALHETKGKLARRLLKP